MPAFSPHTWRLRPAQVTDCEQLLKTCWRDMAHDVACDKLAFMCSLQTQNRALAVVVEAADVLIGYGQVMRWREGAEIADLFVIEMARGFGIGSALIACLLDTARQWGVPYVELGVLQDNLRARALYERLGFYYVQTVALNDDAVLYMRFDLT